LRVRDIELAMINLESAPWHTMTTMLEAVPEGGDVRPVDWSHRFNLKALFFLAHAHDWIGYHVPAAIRHAAPRRDQQEPGEQIVSITNGLGAIVDLFAWLKERSYHLGTRLGYALVRAAMHAYEPVVEQWLADERQRAPGAMRAWWELPSRQRGVRLDLLRELAPQSDTLQRLLRVLERTPKRDRDDDESGPGRKYPRLQRCAHCRQPISHADDARAFVNHTLRRYVVACTKHAPLVAMRLLT
jgi:hypothetical protein